MKSGEIFLIKDDGQLVGMKQSEYESEDLLQELLQKYPNLLAGDQIDSKSPRRWLLISREVGVPDEEEGGDRWSLDHLFLDQPARVGPRQEYEITVEVRKKGSKRGLSTTFLASKMAF